MYISKVVSILTSKHPGKNIVKNDEQNSTEIICEIEPASDHPEYSVAIAVIDKTIPHFHKKSVETYEIVHGELKITVDGIEHKLKEGERLIIKPPSIHFAQGNETIVKVSSKPGWTLEDHILV